MKYKAQIIGILALLAVFGTIFGVWQFHFKEIFEGYKEDDRIREALESSLAQLQENFQGYKPELLIEEWQNQLQPWRNAREERSRFFNFGGWYQVDLTPQEARILKFWYTEESNKMIYDLYMKVYERMGGYDRFPNDIRAILNVASEEDWAGRNVSWEEVERNLSLLSFGTNLTTFLLDLNVTSVRDIVLWPRRIPETFGDMLALQTVGLHITITARELVRMLDRLAQETRYFNVETIKITYPYIAYAVEPQLDVQLLLTQANYRRPPEPQDAIRTAAAPGAEGQVVVRPQVDDGRRRRSQEIEEGAFQRFWRWFKRVVLYMP